MVGVGRVLCQNPSFRRNESEDPGCMDKIYEAANKWVDDQGQQELEVFL